MKIRISSYQATLLLIVTIVPTTIMTLPGLAIDGAKEDAWLVVLLLGIITAGVGLVFVGLLHSMEEQDLVGFFRQTLGNVLTYPVIITVVVALVVLNALIIREVTGLVLTAYLPETPLWMMSLLFLAVALYPVYTGFEVTARVCEVFVPLFIMLFVVVQSFTLKDLDLSRLKPLLADGIAPLGPSVQTGLVFFSEFFVFLIIAPNVADRHNIPKAFAAALSVSVLLILWSVVSIIALFGPQLAGFLTFPLLNVTRYVQALSVVQNLDALFVAFLVIGGVLKVSVLLLSAATIGQKLLALSTHQPVLLGLALAIYVLSLLIVENFAQLIEIIEKVSLPYFALLVGSPLVVLIVAWLRRRLLPVLLLLILLTTSGCWSYTDIEDHEQDLRVSMMRFLEKTTAPVIGAIQKTGADELLIGAGAIFKQGRLVTFLNDKQTRGIGWITTDVNLGSILVEVPGHADRYAVALVTRGKAKVKPLIYDDQIAMAIDIEVWTNMEENMVLEYDLTDPHNLSLLNQRLAQAIRNEVESALYLSQQHKADIFGFGQLLYQTDPAKYHQVEDRWEEVYSTMRVEITVNANIRRLGF